MERRGKKKTQSPARFKKRRIDDLQSDPASEVLPKLTTRPTDLKQLNGSVWEFYRPPHDQVPKVEILFFHGAQLSTDEEAFWKTWLSRDETIVWPKVWLAEKFPEARILSISYDSSVRKCHGQRDIYQTIENLMHDIIWMSTCKAGQNCPVIFAAHCFGGIIVKAFLLKCHEESNRGRPGNLQAKEMKTFLQNCRAVFYYSTPNEGSRLMEDFAFKDYVLGNINQPLVKFLEILNSGTSRINGEFSRLRDSFNPRWLITRAIAESRETKLKDSRKTILVVPEASVRRDVDHPIYWADADHFEVSKARNNSTCSIFTGLCDLVADQYGKASPSTKLKSALNFSNDEFYVPLEKTISEIDDAFRESQVVVLYGDSGMGKSSLARHYALRLEKKHAQGASSSGGGIGQPCLWPAVVFVPCGHGANIIGTQKALLSKFKVEYPREDWKELEEGLVQDLLLDWLNDHLSDRRALVILDDVWETKLVENVLVRGPKLKFFITTRDQNLWGQDAKAIEIEQVDMEHGRRILANYAKGEDHELVKGQADELIEKVGFHPLAVATLGTVLRTKKGQSARKWQELKRDFMQYLTSDSASHRPILFSKSYPRSLHAAMMLMENELDQASRIVLYAINIFEGQRTPESLVQLFLSSTHPDVFKSFCLNIEKLEGLSLVRREAQTTDRLPIELPFTEDGNEYAADETINSEDVEIKYDVFFIHDLRRKFLSESTSRMNDIISFLFVDRESFNGDSDRRSKYDLATFLCSVNGQSYVREMAKIRLPTPNFVLLQGVIGDFLTEKLASAVVKEQASSTTAAIEIFTAFSVHSRVDLHNVPVLLLEPESNRLAIELVCFLLQLAQEGDFKSVLIDNGGSLQWESFERSTLTNDDFGAVFINIGGSLERLAELLSPKDDIKSFVVLSILRFLIDYARRHPHRVSIPEFMSRMLATNLLDMAFTILDTKDRRYGNICKCEVSLEILLAFLHRNAEGLSGREMLIIVDKITCPKNLDIIARFVLEESDVLLATKQIQKFLQRLAKWHRWAPSDVAKALLKNLTENKRETSSLCEAVLRKYIVSVIHHHDDDDDYDDDDDDNHESEGEGDGQGKGESGSEAENVNGDDGDEDDYCKREDRDDYLNNINAVYHFVRFAVVHLRSLMSRAIMQLYQEMKNHDEFALFIACLPRAVVETTIVHVDLKVDCLDKLVERLDQTVKGKSQKQVLRALYILANRDTYGWGPQYEVQVTMLETDHLLERVMMFLSMHPDMEWRCRWAAAIFVRLISVHGANDIEEPMLQGPLFVSLSGKARQFHMCLEKVAMLLCEEVNWDIKINGLEVLLSMARLAFNFARSGYGTLIDDLTISDLLERAVKLLVLDIESIQRNVVGALYIIAQFRFDERLGLEVYMRRLATPDLLKKLAMMLSRKKASAAPTMCESAVLIIQSLATQPAVGESIARFRDNDALIIEKLIGLLELDKFETTAHRFVGRPGNIATAVVGALIRLPVRDQIEARIQNMHIPPYVLSFLYSRWGWANVLRKNYKAALEDLNRAIELDPGEILRIPYLLQECGIVRKYLGDLDGALSDFDRALKIRDVDYECLKHRGLIKYKLGDEEGARKDAERAIEFCPRRVFEYQDQESRDIYESSLGAQSVEFLGYKLR